MYLGSRGIVSVAKTKALISFAVTAKLICVFVLAYAKSWFSHDEAHFIVCLVFSIHVFNSQNLILEAVQELSIRKDR